MHGPTSSRVEARAGARNRVAVRETSSRTGDGRRRERVARRPPSSTVPGLELELEPLAVAGARREPRQLDGCDKPPSPIPIEISAADEPADEPPAQFHFDPETYAEMIRADVPRYEELQERTIEAIPFAPARVLELGFGTARDHPAAAGPLSRDAGSPASTRRPEMVFEARQLGWEEMRLGRMEDPLPDGPWDLVIAVLSVHHLDADGKRDLFRRVRTEARALVIGDVVEVPDERRVASLTEGFDFPSPRAPTRPSGAAARSSGRPTTWR